MGDLLHALAFGSGQREWFFDEYVLAMFHCQDSGGGMKMGRQADIDDVDIWGADHLIEGLEDLETLDRDLFARRAEVALDASPIARAFLGITARERNEFRLIGSSIRERMNPAHESDTNESDSNHPKISFVNGAKKGACDLRASAPIDQHRIMIGTRPIIRNIAALRQTPRNLRSIG